MAVGGCVPLEIGAVIGPEFDLTLLVTAREVGTDDVLELAEQARLVHTVPARPGRYGFAHALIRAALYDDLATSRRLRLHRQIGTALRLELLRRRSPMGAVWMGDDFATDKRRSNPITHFDPTDPPGYLIGAINDGIVPVQNALAARIWRGRSRSWGFVVVRIVGIDSVLVRGGSLWSGVGSFTRQRS